ncbi:MAG: AAA family ATPase [Planctomycetota bacterium]|nr:MAG: AAA family ATPase [Planctomycetota bacterium]
MTIRRYHAPTLTEALARARAAAGPGAVVVDVRRGAGGRRGVVVSVTREPGVWLAGRLEARGVSAARRASLLQGLGRGDQAAHELRRRLAALVPVAVVDRLPRVLALVGPTGVGKTTTIAKLAGQAQFEHGERVGLVTLDLYRVAAVDQLGAYADMLGVPLEVAATPDEVRAALARLRGCDRILIDTAGQSPRDAARMRALEGLVRAAGGATQLVLSATARLQEMRDALRRFGGCGLQGLVLTKLDEAVVAGDVLELLAESPIPLRLVAAGQEVPDDLRPAAPEELAEWILQEAA